VKNLQGGAASARVAASANYQAISCRLRPVLCRLLSKQELQAAVHNHNLWQHMKHCAALLKRASFLTTLLSTSKLSSHALSTAAAAPNKMPTSLQFKKVPRESLHVSKPTHWLESRFHFSFAGHWDPKRMNFGALRVVNDDLVTAREGFGAHPHRDMEIFSYIVDGELRMLTAKATERALAVVLCST
jgi:Pirin